jgi:hypothetical protein
MDTLKNKVAEMKYQLPDVFVPVVLPDVLNPNPDFCKAPYVESETT